MIAISKRETPRRVQYEAMRQIVCLTRPVLAIVEHDPGHMVQAFEKHIRKISVEITMTTSNDYITALNHLVDMARSDANNATTIRVRQLLLALLCTRGHQIELGALIDNADPRNLRFIITVLSGWSKHGWDGIDGLPNSPDMINDMHAALREEAEFGVE